MAVLRPLALAWMVHRTAAVTTTLANCQSACNLGEMLCLNKNASSTLCSAVQGACMAGCYANHVNCGCADASVTHCEEIKPQAPHANDAMDATHVRENFPHRSLTARKSSPSGTSLSSCSSRSSRVCPRWSWSCSERDADAWSGRRSDYRRDARTETTSSWTSSRPYSSARTTRPRRRRARPRFSSRRRATGLRLSRVTQ